MPLDNLSRGEDVVEMFNKAGSTATVLGNHEWDFGAENLKSLLERATFKVLGANVATEDFNGELVRHDSVGALTLLHVGDVPLGVVGVTTTQALTKERLDPDLVEDATTRMALHYDDVLHRQLGARDREESTPAPAPWTRRSATSSPTPSARRAPPTWR